MTSTGIGKCHVCGGAYTVGDVIEQDGMADMGTPRQRWLLRHATCEPTS